jgi:hypothetical protein
MLDARKALRCWLGPTWPTCPPFFAFVARMGVRHGKWFFSSIFKLGWTGWTGRTGTEKSGTSCVQPPNPRLDIGAEAGRARASAATGLMPSRIPRAPGRLQRSQGLTVGAGWMPPWVRATPARNDAWTVDGSTILTTPVPDFRPFNLHTLNRHRRRTVWRWTIRRDDVRPRPGNG